MTEQLTASGPRRTYRLVAPAGQPGPILGVAGLVFVDGVAHTDSVAVAAYCEQAGYEVTTGVRVHPSAVQSAELPQQDVDARDVVPTLIGAPLRDGAVDPRPEDYRAPSNAGRANPHGPLVVAPGLDDGVTRRRP